MPQLRVCDLMVVTRDYGGGYGGGGGARDGDPVLGADWDALVAAERAAAAKRGAPCALEELSIRVRPPAGAAAPGPAAFPNLVRMCARVAGATQTAVLADCPMLTAANIEPYTSSG